MSGHTPPKGQQVPDYTGLTLQTSSMTEPVPLAWGQSRGAPNLIDYVGFAVHKKTAGKGGSFFGKTTEYTYSATILLALCEGPISGIGECYINQGQTTDFAGLGFTLFTGATPQAPWSYLTAHYPSHALGYQGIAYLAAANYNLGQSESLPSHSFEVKAPLHGTGATGAGDADPALIMQDFLTNPQYGASFPSARLDATALLSGPNATTTGDSAYQTYCRAMGWGLSPFIQSQEPAIQIVGRWCQITNTAPVWTGYSLKLIPFGDAPVTGNGVTFVPPTTATFAFTDDDYVQDGDKDPVEASLADWFDAYNAVAIECRDRGYEYNTVPIDWIDLASNQLIGRRRAPVIQAHEICVTDMAKAVVTLLGQRTTYVRRTYAFKVGPEQSALEPMDCGTITESAVLGLAAAPVRVRSIEEQKDGSFEVVVEEFPGVIGSPAASAVTGGAAPPVNALIAPDPVNAPIIFEPNSAAAAFLNNGSTAPLVVALVSGGAGGVADPNWGGAVVNVSADGVTYTPLASVSGSTSISQPASMGVLTSALAAYAGVNPDTTD
ncbi:MAG TPA: phage tail protein, partial [Caulobacteraceae bacterium]|nr:phage tail protein [Caulobacteraceae bacterium]